MILEHIREGGWGAYLAILIGLLGLVLGGISIVSLLGKSRASFALGVATLIVALAAASVGIAGTFWGRHQMNQALAYVDSDVDKERISRVGYREAQQSSWVGLFAALLPLMLGGAAAIGGSRLQQPKTRSQFGGDQMAASDDAGSGQTVVAFIFTAMAVLACGGAYAIANGEIPKSRYGFDEQDQENWSLAGALEDVKKNKPNGCERLEEAVGHFWEPSDRREWPHKLRGAIAPELAEWRPAADACMKTMIAALDEGRGGDGLTREELSQNSLLESPLLQNDELRARLLAWKPKEAEEEAEPTGESTTGLGGLGLKGNPKEPTVGTGSLEPSEIRKVIQRNLSKIRFCYETQLMKAPQLEGKIVVSFTIGQNGNVTSATDASEQPFPEKKVTQCVLTRFKQLEFPRPLGGGVVNVKYPLIFKSAG